MIVGFFSRAMLNSVFISFSDSPTYFEIRSDEETEKNVPSASVAHAFAKYVFPVPGGPYNNMPFHGFLAPLNISGNFMGKITASYKAFLAPSSPAISVHFTLGFSVTIASDNASLNFPVSSSLLPAPPPPPPVLII
jgi:hypothetical protein